MSLATFGYERFQEAARVAECACAYAERQSHRRRDARHAIRGSTEPDGACGDVGLGKYCRGKAAKKRTGVRSFPWLRTRIHVRVGESPYRRPRYSCSHGIRLQVSARSISGCKKDAARSHDQISGLLQQHRLVSFSERRQATPEKNCPKACSRPRSAFSGWRVAVQLPFFAPR